MKFTDIFIRRPILALSISLLIVLLGLQALKGMQVREYPKITNTVITVTTSYYGASANLIQGFITQPLEQAIAQADNIDYMTSKSQLGSSTITVNMKLNTDPNAALSDVLAKVNSVRSQLPKESEDPSLDMSTGSSTSIMYISFSSDELNASQITDYLERVIKPQLFTVGGGRQGQPLRRDRVCAAHLAGSGADGGLQPDRQRSDVGVAVQQLPVLTGSGDRLLHAV